MSDARQETGALLELTEGGDDLVRNFLRILVDKSRESELAEIYQALWNWWSKRRGSGARGGCVGRAR